MSFSSSPSNTPTVTQLDCVVMICDDHMQWDSDKQAAHIDIYPMCFGSVSALHGVAQAYVGDVL